MKKILVFSIVVAALILSACAGSSSEAPVPPVTDIMPAYGGAAPQTQLDTYNAAPPSGVEQPVAEENAGVAATSDKRIVVKNADLSIVVSDVEGRMKAIQSMAEEMGGFVVSSNLYQSYTNDYVQVPEATITVRVPAEKLNNALDQIKKGVVEVQTETVSGQDVTAEYVDLQSNLKSLEATEEQLNKILEEATTTEDVVNIFNQLTYYRQQIEVIKGQIKYYDEASALSSISVRIIAEETIQPVTIGKWEPKGVALESVQNLLDFYQGFTEFLIRFVIFILPVLLTIGLFLYLLFLLARAIFRKLRGNKPKKEQTEQTEKK